MSNLPTNLTPKGIPMPSPSPRRRGAPLGNINALKHGFYTRRLKKHDLSGVEATDAKNLVEEIAIVRVFTRRLIESLDPAADAYEVAGALRILCVALATITRAMKAQHWLTLNSGGVDNEISEAIKQVYAELCAEQDQPEQEPSPASYLDTPPTMIPDFIPPDDL